MDIKTREHLWLHHSNEAYEILYGKMSEEAKKIITKILALEKEKNEIYWSSAATDEETKTRDELIRSIDNEILNLNTELQILEEKNKEDEKADEVLTYKKLMQDEVERILESK